MNRITDRTEAVTAHAVNVASVTADGGIIARVVLHLGDRRSFCLV